MLTIIQCTARQFLEDSRNHPATLLFSIAFIITVINQSCYVLLSGPALSEFGQLSFQLQGSQAQISSILTQEHLQNMQTVKSSSSSNNLALSVHPLELEIKSLPMADFRPPPLLLPLYHYVRCCSLFSQPSLSSLFLVCFLLSKRL